MPENPEDRPPHEAAGPMQSAVPRPIEVSPIHFRAQGRCYAAFVVDVLSDDPLSPVFRVDAVVFAPRDRKNRDRFTRVDTLPGTVRWANNLRHALPGDGEDGAWPELTWHYPGRHCLPEVVLHGAQS